MSDHPEDEITSTTVGAREERDDQRGFSEPADGARASTSSWKDESDPWRERAGSSSTADQEDPPGAREQRREQRRERRATHPGAENGDRPVVGIVRELLGDVWLLARQELQLARAEAGEKFDQAKKGASELGMGAALAYAGLLFVLLAAVLGLDEALDRPWLSALIVGGTVLGIGMALLATARSNLKAKNLKPERSARSLREDVALVRDEGNRRNQA